MPRSRWAGGLDALLSRVRMCMCAQARAGVQRRVAGRGAPPSEVRARRSWACGSSSKPPLPARGSSPVVVKAVVARAVAATVVVVWAVVRGVRTGVVARGLVVRAAAMTAVEPAVVARAAAKGVVHLVVDALLPVALAQLLLHDLHLLDGDAVLAREVLLLQPPLGALRGGLRLRLLKRLEPHRGHRALSPTSCNLPFGKLGRT